MPPAIRLTADILGGKGGWCASDADYAGFSASTVGVWVSCDGLLCGLFGVQGLCGAMQTHFGE